MSTNKITFAFVCFTLLISLPVASNKVFSQVKIASALIKQDTSENSKSISDSLGLISGMVSIQPERHSKSGNLAMLLSAVIPGAGQVYAHRYYTIPIIWGFGAYFVSSWINADKTYRDFRRRFSESVQLDSLHIGNADLQRSRDDWRNDRDGFAFYLILTYALNIIDAYIGAVLYDFSVSDNLGGSAEIRFRIPIR